MSAIYVLKAGQEVGPFDRDQLVRAINAGEFSLDDRAWYEALEDWQPLREVLGVGASASRVAVLDESKATWQRIISDYPHRELVDGKTASGTPWTGFKLFSVLFGSVIAAVFFLWLICFVIHVEKERTVLQKLDALVKKEKTRDLKAMSASELDNEVAMLNAIDQERDRAIRSGSDPFWFIRTEDDLH